MKNKICLCGDCDYNIIKSFILPSWVHSEVEWITDVLGIKVDIKMTQDEEYRENIASAIRRKLGKKDHLAAAVINTTQECISAKLKLLYRDEEPDYYDACIVDISLNKFLYITYNE